MDKMTENKDFLSTYYSTVKTEYHVTGGRVEFSNLPIVGQMMIWYSGITYNPDIHSPTMDKDETPHWLTDKKKDHKFVHIYDLDGKVTRDFVLSRSLGEKLGLLPRSEGGEEVSVRTDAMETQLFFLMNRMTWMINKVCYDPEKEVSYDEVYARNRFTRRMNVNMPNLNLLLSPPNSDVTESSANTTSCNDGISPHYFITGPAPTYIDFLAYACLYDLRSFVPGCFTGNNNFVTEFMGRMEGLPELKEWYESQSGEYIRPPRPSITTRIGYFA